MNWQFALHPDHTINLDHNNRSLAQLLEEKEPTSRICMACGSCGGTCTAGQFEPISFRHILLMVRRGETESVRSELTKCMYCGKCTLVCPRGVNTRHILDLLRTMLIN